MLVCFPRLVSTWRLESRRALRASGFAVASLQARQKTLLLACQTLLLIFPFIYLSSTFSRQLPKDTYRGAIAKDVATQTFASTTFFPKLK